MYMHPTREALAAAVADRDCVVVGSAPMPAPLVLSSREVVVAVNGGISSTPARCDVWVLNAREGPQPGWGPDQRHVNAAMVAQAAGRHVPLAVLLLVTDDAAEPTQRRVAEQGTRIDAALAINRETRRDVEASVGARSPDMSKHALSAGVTAAVLCLWGGAATVRLEGLSFTPGYAYETPTPVTARGHVGGDVAALLRLEARYGARIVHRLPIPESARKEFAMANERKPAAPVMVPGAAPVRKVQAKKLLFYNMRRYRPGDIFELRSPKHFKPSQMEAVAPSTPVRSIDPREAARREHQAIAAGKSPRLQPNAADLEPEEPTGVGAAARVDEVL